MKRIFTALCLMVFAWTAVSVYAAGDKTGKTPGFFAIASVDKPETNVNDQIVYTIKFYMDPDAQLEAVGNINFKFNGFDAEEADPFFFQNYSAETYKGKTYRTLVWKQFVLTPQKKGTFIIPSYKATASLIVYSNDDDGMDPFSFFFRRRRGQRKAVKFTTKALKVKVTGSKKKVRPQQPDEDDGMDDGIEYKKL